MFVMWRVMLVVAMCCGVASAQAQSAPGAMSPYDPLSKGTYQISPLTQPTITPGMVTLLELETKFANAVARGGGKAFSSWFAEDGVSLANKEAPVMGRAAIAARAVWDPKEYQLTWVAAGAQMGPSNDMGFTWGHYDGSSKDVHGETVKTSGRYFTVWKKQADGEWKVALDASAEEPAGAGSCCILPKP